MGVLYKGTFMVRDCLIDSHLDWSPLSVEESVKTGGPTDMTKRPTSPGNQTIVVLYFSQVKPLRNGT